MTGEIHILMLEDSPADAELARHTLREGGIRFTDLRVESEKDFVEEIQRRPPDLILSDYALPGFDGYAALEIAKRKCPETPFIFLTGTLGEEVAIETLKNGATDYVLKQRLQRLVPSVHRALREATDRAERQRAEAQLRESHQQLRALSEYLQRVREEERTRIAREVHDELGQALTSCKLDLSRLASRLSKDQSELAQRARALAAHMDSTIQTVRRIATELRPGILDHLGLVAALEWQANEFQTRTGIRCEVHTRLRARKLAQELATTFFRIFQETLTNVIRHAGATQVQVHLNEGGRDVILEVRDNGRGISASDISSPRSVGLVGMKERAALLGGHFEIGPARSGKGTLVRVSIPRGGHHRPGRQGGGVQSGGAGNEDDGLNENFARRRSRRGSPRFETDSGR